MKKIVGTLIALLVAVQFAVPVFALEANAESPAPSTEATYREGMWEDRGVETAASRYLRVNGKVIYDGTTVENSVKGANFNKKTKTLTLQNYKGKGIYAENINLKIKVKGTNKIKSYNYDTQGGYKVNGGITVYGGNVTIVGSGKLDVNVSGKAHFTDGIITEKNINIASGTKVNVNVKGKGFTCALTAINGKIVINAKKKINFVVQADSSTAQNLYYYSMIANKIIVQSSKKTIIKQGFHPSAMKKYNKLIKTPMYIGAYQKDMTTPVYSCIQIKR